MPKRTTNAALPQRDGRKAKAKAAIENILGSIHDENRQLGGEELVKVVQEVFDLVRTGAPSREGQ